MIAGARVPHPSFFEAWDLSAVDCPTFADARPLPSGEAKTLISTALKRSRLYQRSPIPQSRLAFSPFARYR